MSPQQHMFGIQELYCPKDKEATIDIVAVHGLTGGALKTWTSNDGKTCWLNNSELLPKYLKNARILTWGYNADIASLMGKTASSSDRILQHAQTLVAQLHADRQLEGATERPIIFLCHSLGGIIVKRGLAYSESRTASKIAHLHSIYTCTYAILFFGTPHSGSNKARLLDSLQKIVSLTVPRKVLHTESSLLSALEEESETLQNIIDQFAPLMCRFRIFFFWEQEKTDLKYTRDYIVTESSAAPILDNTERSGIAADHRGICKFENSRDQGFRTVVAALQRYSLDALQVVQARIIRSAATLSAQRWHDAGELVKGAQTSDDTQIAGAKGNESMLSDAVQPAAAKGVQGAYSGMLEMSGPQISPHQVTLSDFRADRDVN